MQDTFNRERAEIVDFCTSKVIGIIDERDQVESALRALLAAGFAERLIEVFCSLEGEHELDLRGEYHGFWHRFKSKLHHFQLLEERQLDAYENALLAGCCVVQVHTNPFCWKDAHQVLKSSGVRFINFYGQLTTQTLEP